MGAQNNIRQYFYPIFYSTADLRYLNEPVYRTTTETHSQADMCHKYAHIWQPPTPPSIILFFWVFFFICVVDFVCKILINTDQY